MTVFARRVTENYINSPFQAGDISAEDLVSKYQPHCILVVLAVDDLTSLEYADSILEYLKSRYIYIFTQIQY